MKRFAWLWLVASSISLMPAATAETRPLYGGTLRVAMREAPGSLDPADAKEADSFARRNLIVLIFETLVTVDDRGRVHAGLATDWQAAPGNLRWQFRIRRGVRFHDGSPLTAEIAASSLRTANPAWKVFAESDSVIVERDHDSAELPAEIALPRNSIVKRNNGSKLSGTGPFRIEDWEAGKNLVLAAEEDHWRGRAFVDKIEVGMGRNFHDQLVELELGKADLVEVPPEQAHRAAMEGRRVSRSQPMELVALVFNGDAQTDDAKLLRGALAHVDRASMQSALLQGAGQAAGGILPNWISGYGFVFSTGTELQPSRENRGQVRTVRSWTVGYDANDPLARVLAERVALTVKDAGLVLQPTTAATADVRLTRIPLASADPWVALSSAAGALRMAMPKMSSDSVEDLYGAERELLARQRVIPLFHLPTGWASSPALRDFMPGADGSWRLADVWLEKETP